MFSAEQIAKKIGFRVDKLLECPECKRKKLFPEKHQAFNAHRRKDGVEICTDCGQVDFTRKKK